jgi:hypothetical protein
MQKTKKTLLRILAVVLCIVIVSLYRSYFDNKPFLQVFDLTLRAITSGIWLLIQNPIVLTAIVLFIFIWTTQDSLPKILSAITEVKAGDFSAKIDGSKLFLDEIAKEAIKPDNNKQPEHNIDYLRTVIENASEGFLWYLIKVNGKDMSLDKHIELLSKEEPLRDFSEDNKLKAALGFITGTMFLLSGITHDLYQSETKGNYIVTIRPEAFEIIKEILHIS